METQAAPLCLPTSSPLALQSCTCGVRSLRRSHTSTEVLLAAVQAAAGRDAFACRESKEKPLPQLVALCSPAPLLPPFPSPGPLSSANAWRGSRGGSSSSAEPVRGSKKAHLIIYWACAPLGWLLPSAAKGEKQLVKRARTSPGLCSEAEGQKQSRALSTSQAQHPKPEGSRSETMSPPPLAPH